MASVARSIQHDPYSMSQLARSLGDFVPGAEPQFRAPGSPQQICGTYRAGSLDGSTPASATSGGIPSDSVVDRNSRVWGQRDLYLGGCGVIPTQTASNPVLTAACFAIHAAEQVVQSLQN